MMHLRFFLATFLFCFSAKNFAEAKEVNSKGQSKELTTQALFKELTGKDITSENDIELYAQMVSSYEKNDEIGLKSRLKSMLERFPKSPYADNALYLAGRMAIDSKNYAEALRFFSRIETEYPKSNKIVAAKFAKAMTYRAMNLPEISNQVLEAVRNNYLGSPESFRANAELKMMKKEI